MSEYIKNFVSANGISFKISERNRETFETAKEKWREIESDLQIGGDSVILFCGAKSNGKSSLVRYLLNSYNKETVDRQDDNQTDRNSSKEGEDFDDIEMMDSSSQIDEEELRARERYAYHVDFDPGQPETTTPGLVSAHIVYANGPGLVSPTYLNVLQHYEVAKSCVGGTNMSVNPRLYIETCRYIMTMVKRHKRNQSVKRPIFINTMGYIRNVGLAMLIDLIKICKPTDLVVLNVKNDPMRTIYANLSCKSIRSTPASFIYETSLLAKKLKLYRHHLHDLEFSFTDSSAIARKNRTALQLAYFGSMPEALYKPIMLMTPKWLDLNAVSVYCVSSYPLKESIVLELLHHSWVHLVKLRQLRVQPLKIKDNNKDEPENDDDDEDEDDEDAAAAASNDEKSVCNIIDEINPNIMYGCGIVTKIDLVKRRLMIVTPLEQNILDKTVNCVIKPLSIQIPPELLSTSLSCESDLP